MGKGKIHYIEVRPNSEGDEDDDLDRNESKDEASSPSLKKKDVTLAIVMGSYGPKHLGSKESYTYIPSPS